MNTNNEEQKLTRFIDSFAGVLNAADVASIPSFFSEDGKFMPNGVKTITGLDTLVKSAKNNLAKIAFQIQFTVEEIQIDGHFAFITAKANTSQLEAGSELLVNKTTRDFFVLKKESVDWKIYRYIFNYSKN